LSNYVESVISVISPQRVIAGIPGQRIVERVARAIEISRFVSWELLHEQMGAEYSTVKNFSQKARGALRKVQAVYPGLGLEFEPGGVRVLPCNPAVTIKPRAVK
jgi:hypothetical protein